MLGYVALRCCYRLAGAFQKNLSRVMKFSNRGENGIACLPKGKLQPRDITYLRDESKKSRDKIIGHVPNVLDGILTSMTGEITGEGRKAPVGTWVIGGGIELPRVYYIYGSKKHKAQVRKEEYGKLRVGRPQKICVH